MNNKSTINCPNCNTAIDVNDILKNQLEGSIRKEFQLKADVQANEINAKNEALIKEKAEFEIKKQHENELFAERLAKEKKIAEKEITSKIKLSLEEENKDRFF